MKDFVRSTARSSSIRGSREARVARAQVLSRNGQAGLARRDQAETQRINAANAAVGRAMILIESGRARAREGHDARRSQTFARPQRSVPSLRKRTINLATH